MGRDAIYRVRLVRDPCNLALSTSRDTLGCVGHYVGNRSPEPLRGPHVPTFSGIMGTDHMEKSSREWVWKIVNTASAPEVFC